MRTDLEIIASFIEPGSRVLDVGCGSGELLQNLVESKKVDARGMELAVESVANCLSKGLSVIQGNADTDLADYPEKSFDYAILSHTIQATARPEAVLSELVRISSKAIVAIPNFGYWKNRMHLLVKGKMPVNPQFPYLWYNTPNIHFCTIRDFLQLTSSLGIKVERKIALKPSGKSKEFSVVCSPANWYAEQAVFLLSR